ncbi:hypothetical protein IGI04_011633 [Brassica rapa subsp. trilocularis]|uniref:RING-type E3 ubiquitin transferase n=2 Tax=Brassica campestris TaxID=3711 RepID=M4CAL9_BRACM|nr:hypothetical protein IGI04_011633 [Brassica rapa subsp. trilocularis]
MKRKDRTRVEEDFRKAVQLDHNSVKARLFFYYWHCMRSFLLLPSYGGLHVGKFDPITREKLDPSKLVPNLAIKEAVAAYLERHVWAYKVGS